MNDHVGGARMRRDGQASLPSRKTGADRDGIEPDRPSRDVGGSDAVSGEPGAGPSEEDLIARNLRTLFSTIEAEPLPPRLQSLLRRLSEEDGDPASDDRSGDAGEDA